MTTSVRWGKLIPNGIVHICRRTGFNYVLQHRLSKTLLNQSILECDNLNCLWDATLGFHWIRKDEIPIQCGDELLFKLKTWLEDGQYSYIVAKAYQAAET